MSGTGDRAGSPKPSPPTHRVALLQRANGEVVVLITLWSVKGGSGVSVVSAGIACSLARDGTDTLVVDRAGDQPALFGLAAPQTPGVTDWLVADDSDRAALSRLELDVSPSLRLLPRGDAGPSGGQRDDALVAALHAEDRTVVVDGGTGSATADALADAGTSLLVVRPCYLALRRAVQSRARADGLVLIEEPGRALDATDVARALGTPIRAVVQWDPAVARSVDAGLLASRLPRAFARSLRGVA